MTYNTAIAVANAATDPQYGLAASWTGVYDVTPDWNPVLGALPGVDGLALCQLVSAHWSVLGHNVRTLVISGDTDPGEIARLSASGVNLLSKPFRSERLQERLLALMPPGQTPFFTTSPQA